MFKNHITDGGRSCLFHHQQLCVGGVIFFSFTAFFQPIQQEFGWSYTQISLATSLRGLEMGIFAPIVGFLVDRFGSRKLLLGGSVIIGIGLLILSFAQSLLMFYMCFLFIALGAGGCTSVVTMTAVAVWFRKRWAGNGIMASGFGAGGPIVLLVVFLIDACGWRLTLVTGASMWLLGIPLSFIVRAGLRNGLSPETGCGIISDRCGRRESPKNKRCFLRDNQKPVLPVPEHC
jgi:MFS family permease